MFIGVTILLFLLRSPALVPGDPVRMIAGERAISPAVREQVIKDYGLDRPIYVQYAKYMEKMFQGNLGESYQQRRPVTSVLWSKFPNTLKLALVAIVIEGLIGISAGILSAVKRYSFWDMLVTLGTSILVAVPVFWLGMGLQVLFGIEFKKWGLPYLPVQGTRPYRRFISFSRPSPWPLFRRPTPRGSCGASCSRSTGRTTSARLRQRGSPGDRSSGGIRCENAMIPVITFLAIDLGAMVGGTILTETVFNWDGVGFAIFQAINNRDWPIVTGGVLVIVVMVMVINLLADISYAFLDPRIRYGHATE